MRERVQSALARQNQDAPGGNVTAGDSEQVLRTTGRFTDPEAFNGIFPLARLPKARTTDVRHVPLRWVEDAAHYDVIVVDSVGEWFDRWLK